MVGRLVGGRGPEDDAAAEGQRLGRGTGAGQDLETVAQVGTEGKQGAEGTGHERPPCTVRNHGKNDRRIMPDLGTPVQTLAAHLRIGHLADLHSVQGEYGKAEPLFRQALDLRKAALGKRHTETATSLNNLALLYTAQFAAEGKVEILHTAFATTEQGRARVFLEQIGRARAGHLAGLSATDRAREAELLGQLRRLEVRLEKLVSTPQHDPAAIHPVQDEREQLENQLQQFIRLLEKKSPQFAALRYPRPCTIAEARACLSAALRHSC